MVDFDIPGAYLNNETNEEIFMVLELLLAGLMVKVYPKLYKKYVTLNIKGKLILCVKIHKSICESLIIILLCYKC